MGYIDPNIFGVLSQAGLAILLVVGAVATFFGSSLKKLFGLKAKDDSKNASSEDEPKSER